MSRDELLREFQKLQLAQREYVTRSAESERERLLQELYLHQAELEMQNHELREAQERLEEARLRYLDLYELAPVGYCTLDRAGGIQELNLTGAALLGAPRETLLGSLFAVAVPLTDDRPLRQHLLRCARAQTRVTSEITLGS